MIADRSRPFTLIDAMILIAAIAIGMGTVVALDRFEAAREASFEPLPPLPPSLPELPPLSGTGSEPNEPVVGVQSPALLPTAPSLSVDTKLDRLMKVRKNARSIAVLLGCCTLGLVALRLRRPRPPLRQLVLRPGSTAPAALLFLAIFYGVNEAVRFFHGDGDLMAKLDFFIMCIPDPYLFQATPCILLFWTALAVARKWRVRGWIEWSGVVAGVLLVLTNVAYQIVAPLIIWAL